MILAVGQPCMRRSLIFFSLMQTHIYLKSVRIYTTSKMLTMLSNTSLYASSMQYYFLQMNVRYTINTFDTRYRNIEIKCQIRSLNVLCRYRFSSFLVMDTIFLLKYRHWFILPVLHENKDIHVLCRQHCALPIRKFLVIKNRFHIDVMTFQGFIKHKNNDSFEKGICNTICSSIPYAIILYITNIKQLVSSAI